MSDKQSSSLIAANQLVLGYTLRERIGSGGYGEVWRADAPGGLPKAVKFVYGFHDDNRAQRELKAIERIKHIRHPFLLSLERVDVVDGRMVVVSELADGSLKDRFDACRSDGLDAIPRDELLQYIRESAEALDFISEEHGLAHLDVKPENLLVVGGHIKVADFGLVKDLQATLQSLMDGLTPAYAPPELFDGIPNKASDQYSLAIVFQEMLTGVRPFSGATAAQLANQHLHSWPNLNPLPRGDQAIIARALAKDPAKRFPNCRTMVEELERRRARPRGRFPENQRSADSEEAVSTGTRLRNEFLGSVDQTGTLSQPVSPAFACEGPVEYVDPLPLDESIAFVRPTLFIGVGNTGVRVIRKLKRLMVNRYGPPDNTPSFKYMCIDVDRRTLYELDGSDDVTALRSAEVVNIPLRRPEEYRNDSRIDLGWIGRRWIYNVPKSQLTESLRPLGRLAFVDHHETIFRRVATLLEELKREESLAATAEATALSPSRQSPQVFLVGSVSGGLASGMLADLAFSVRIAMSEQGFSDENVYGLLLHGTSRQQADHRLAVANACAFLKELNHMNIHGYPGSPGCRIPPFSNETTAFDSAWFVHIGDDLSDSAYDAGVESVAQYLYLGTATRSTVFFDKRRIPGDEEYHHLHTMALAHFGGNGRGLLSETVSYLYNRLMESWLEPSADAEVRELYKTTAEQIAALAGAKPGHIAESLLKIGSETLGGETTSRLLETVQTNRKQHPAGATPAGTLAVLETVFANVLGTSDPASRAAVAEPVLVTQCDQRIPLLVKTIRESLTRGLKETVENPRIRLGGARQIAQGVVDLLKDSLVSRESEKRLLQEESEQWKSRLSGLETERKPAMLNQGIEECTRELVRCRVALFWNGYLMRMLQRVIRDANAVVESIDDQRRLFEKLWHRPVEPSLRTAARSVDDLSEETPELTYLDLVRKQVHNDCRQLFDELDEIVRRQILEKGGGMQALLAEGQTRIRTLPSEICGEANIMVNRYLQLLDIDAVLARLDDKTRQVRDMIEEVHRDGSASLQSCGGKRRLIIAIPQRAPIPLVAGPIQRRFDQGANIVPSTCGDMIVCSEMEDVPIEHIAARVLMTQPNCAELIGRIPSRNDVDWSNVIPLC
jgi:eukaryotic-like serine/threonine-protein kinase